MANYSGSLISRCEAKAGDVLTGHNFCQEVQNTPIFDGITGLTFIDCNLVNCKVPADAIVQSCNTAQIDRCSHLNPCVSYVCEPECRHTVSKEDIIVDGVVVDTLYVYEDKVV